MAKLLVLEDDQLMACNLRDFLESQRHSIELFQNGQSALDHIGVSEYDLLILDWDVPLVSGLDVCKRYRDCGGHSPVLFLTAKKNLGDKILGFDAGGDDYLTKPFEMKELLVRISALLRRSSSVVSTCIKAGDLEIDIMKRQVLKSGVVIRLQKREYQFLEFLMRHQNQSFSTNAIILRVWPSDSEVGPDAVKTLVSRLRRKIDPGGQLIKTLPGYGYILENS
jgi:DNA-binding response OmpR family regulator